jgi:anthranilate phosphoribosyltransferase
MNAAAALIVAGKAANLADGVDRAMRAIDGGAAAQALEKLIAITNDRD